MKLFPVLLLVICLFLPSVSHAEDEDEGSRSILTEVLLYLPNRILDLTDIIRLRLRCGPGVAVSVRATDYVDLYLGSYIAFYGGLPGPRLEPTVPIPGGIENLHGMELSTIDLTLDGGMHPDYSPTEFGAGIQLAVIGLDVGIDPVEIFDFVVGFFGKDIREDDL